MANRRLTSADLRASLWMLAASALFASMGVCVKLAAAALAPMELIWWRGVIPALVILGWVWATGRGLSTPNTRLHVMRGISGVTAMVLYFHAIALIPLASAVTLNYTSPLFLAVILPVFFKQQASLQLRGALLIGFVGLVLVLRPSLASDQWGGALMGLGSGFLASLAYLSVRELGQAGEPEWRIVFFFSLLNCVAGVPGLLSWLGGAPYTPVQWLTIVGIGVFGLLAQLCMTRAYRTGATLVTASLSNSTVIFASLFGWLIWGESLSAWAWLGVALIVLGSTLANLRRG
jgi:drug/metabolite transporter (DMT)-like permease